jgi:hypothetical protein
MAVVEEIVELVKGLEVVREMDFQMASSDVTCAYGSPILCIKVT